MIEDGRLILRAAVNKRTPCICGVNLFPKDIKELLVGYLIRVVNYLNRLKVAGSARRDLFIPYLSVVSNPLGSVQGDPLDRPRAVIVPPRRGGCQRRVVVRWMPYTRPSFLRAFPVEGQRRCLAEIMVRPAQPLQIAGMNLPA